MVNGLSLSGLVTARPATQSNATAASVQLRFSIWRHPTCRSLTQVRLNDKRRQLIRRAIEAYSRQTALGDTVVNPRSQTFSAPARSQLVNGGKAQR
jgi:hypothetical protein